MKKIHYALIALGIIIYLIFLGFLINNKHGIDVRSEELTPMITPRQEVGIASMNGLIYVVGGFEDFHKDSDKVEVYNPKNNSWHAIEPLPRALHHPGVIAFGNRLYVIGGFSTNGSAFAPINDVYVHNGDNWMKGKSMPTARGALGLAIYENKIYAIGGSNVESSLTAVESFDPSTQKWEASPNMKTPRDHISVVIFDEKIIVLGGRDARDCYGNIYRCLTKELFPQSTASVESFDPKTKAWTTEPDLLMPRGALVAVSDESNIYLFGGEYFGGVNKEFEQYGEEKKFLKTDLTARHGAGSVLMDGYMYIVGGSTNYYYEPSGLNERITIPPR